MSMTFIGSTLHAVAASTAETAEAYGALTMTEVGEVLSIGELIDKASDQPFTKLKGGRVTHLNGEVDLGIIPVVLDYKRDDAGYILLKPLANGTTVCTFRVEDADGDEYFFQGTVANMGTPERTANAQKTVSFEIRTSTGLFQIEGT